MKPFIKPARFVAIFCLLIFSSCSNNQEPDPNEEALVLEFGISELPNADFSIDQSTGIIKISNPGPSSVPTKKTSLTAEFVTSKGASALVQDSVQTSGFTSNSFEKGLYYTVISEDGLSQKEYWVYLERSFPTYYYLNQEPDLSLNPSGIAPLSGEIMLESRTPVSVQLEILGDIPVTKEFSASENHTLPLLGLYPDKENEVVVSISDGSGLTARDTLIAQTDPIPDFFPEVEINTKTESLMEPGMHFSEVHIGNAGDFNSYPLIFDNNGDIRWYIDLSRNGHITWPVQFNEDKTFFTAFDNKIYNLDMLGNEISQIKVPENYIHHEVIKLPNGNYVAAVTRLNTQIIDDENIERESVDDFIVEVDGTTGEILTEWDMGEVLDVDRIDLNDPNTGDWLHMNAIWYDESDESLVISGRNQGLVKVNWDNEVQWIMAPHKGWGKAGRTGEGPETSPYLLTAVDQNGEAYSQDIQDGKTENSSFSWAWGQHAPMLLPNGSLFVFDNGFHRNFGASSNYSMGTEYEIDEENMTVKKVWSYGKIRGDDTFSNIISDVDFLPETGNRLFAPGFITGPTNSSKIIELTYPDKQVVFESTLHFKNQLSDGSNGWGNIDISYRAERISLYNHQSKTKRWQIARRK